MVEFLLRMLDLDSWVHPGLGTRDQGVWQERRRGSRKRPELSSEDLRSAGLSSASADLAHNNGKVCKRQLRIKSGQDLGMWEVSVLDAREGDGTEGNWSGRATAFKKAELPALLKHQVAL